MGKGRTKLPASIKILKAAARNAPAASPGSLGEPPADLSAEAQACWRLLAPQVEAAGLATSLDRLAFAMLCTEFGEWKRHPGYRHASNFLRLARDFGLTPLSRSKLRATTPPKDDLADFLGEKLG